GPDAARPDRLGRAPEGLMSGPVPLLAAEKLSRSFGGLRAVDEVSLTLEPGLLHAVIGTNGAGKSTLINLLSGELAASSGRVMLLGEDVTGWSQPRRARAGLGRSYQRNTIFPEFTVFENCRLSAQANRPQPWNWLATAARCRFSGEHAADAIARA